MRISVKISKVTISMLSGKRRALFWSALSIVILTGIILLYSGSVHRTLLGAGNKNQYVKARIVSVKEDYTEPDEEMHWGTQLVEAKILTGEHTGEVCELSNNNSYLTGAYCQVGTNVIVLIGEGEGGLTGTVYNYDRNVGIWTLIALFIVVLCLIGGKKGIATSVALIFTFICILCLYIPMLYQGVSPFIAAVLSSVLILTVSILLIDGWTKKAICAMLGTVIGVITAGGIAAFFGNICKVSGYNIADAETMIHIANYSQLQISGVLFSGILLASLGAVMDVSVSIAAAINEIHYNNPEFDWKKLYQSGMRVGHDMMGTMSNTLILAFVGNSVNTLLIVYAYNMSYFQIMSQYSIAIEILRGIAGTLGIILTVPIESLIAAFILGEK